MEIDDALAQSGDYAEVGATACAAIVDDAAITVAWLGDSRCVLARGDGSVRALSRDHTPDSPTETSRIVEAEGYVYRGRVNGASRAA